MQAAAVAAAAAGDAGVQAAAAAAGDARMQAAAAAGRGSTQPSLRPLPLTIKQACDASSEVVAAALMQWSSLRRLHWHRCACGRLW
jgi:hypothetical protein